MQGVFRKLYMSILATAMILLTSIATTFAWVGMLTSSSLGSFDIDLKVENLDNEYYLTICNTDSTNSGDYGDSVRRIDIQKQIMDNMLIDYSAIDSSDSNAVNNIFSRRALLTPVTTDVNLTKFYMMDNLGSKDKNHILDLHESRLFFKFDVFLSVEAVNSSTTEINANVFFESIEKAFIGSTNEKGELISDIHPFQNLTHPETYDPFNVLPSIPRTGIKVNSASAARLAFAIYDPIKLTDTYDESTSPSNIIIYQGGTKYPTLNDGIYSLGGILPEEYNYAIKRLEQIYKVNLDIDSSATARMNFDREMKEKVIDPITNQEVVNNELFTKPGVPDSTNVNYLGVQPGMVEGVMKPIQTKMKISIYFWFEGWDADCLEFIDRQPVSLAISLSTDKTTTNNS